MEVAKIIPMKNVFGVIREVVYDGNVRIAAKSVTKITAPIKLKAVIHFAHLFRSW